MPLVSFFMKIKKNDQPLTSISKYFNIFKYFSVFETLNTNFSKTNFVQFQTNIAICKPSK